MRALGILTAISAMALLVGGIAWATHEDTSTPEAAAVACSKHHGFGAGPIDVAKTADHNEVLAQVGWGANPRGDCYLVLDEQSLSVLRDHRAGVSATPTGEEVVGGLIKSKWPSVYECLASSGADCEGVRYERSGILLPHYCAPDRSYARDPNRASCKVRGTDWTRRDVIEDSAMFTPRTIWSYLEADPARSQFTIRGDLPTVNVACDHRVENGFAVWIAFPGEHIMGQSRYEGKVPIVYMFDEVGATVQYEWESGNDEHRGMFPNERIFPPDPLAFAASLANSPEFTLTLWNHDNSKIGPVVFDTTGSAREIKRVMEACGIDRYPTPNAL